MSDRVSVATVEAPGTGDWFSTVGYFTTAFLGAALLFGLEPLFVKMALPLFGGAPAVWNIAFAFFTVVFLAGYLYAHAISRLTIKRQILIHGLLLLSASALLPVRVGSTPIMPSSLPVPQLLVLLFKRIGLPFFALSATAPIVQSWSFCAAQWRDPYRLFAASNLGSIAALLAYPFLVEPFAGLALQSRLWSIGYALFIVSILACGTTAIAQAATYRISGPELSVRPSLLPGGVAARVSWVTFSAIPIVLMMGLTTHLTSEIESLPFLWTLPLALYLLAYALTFAGLSALWLFRLTPFFVLPVVVLLTLHEKLIDLPYLSLTLCAFFLLTLGVIGRLAAARPAPQHLTEFYLCIAIGGAMGGIIASLVAPLVFPSIGEYPLAIVLSCLLHPSSTVGGRPSLSGFLKEGAAATCIIGVAGLLTHFAPLAHTGADETALFWLTLSAGICLTFFERPIRFGLCVGALLLYGTLLPEPGGLVIARERNFFGPKRIVVDPSGSYRFLLSGGTVHGVQALDPARQTEPLAYYSRSGPLGDVFAAGAESFSRRNIAVIGLGIGSAACYERPGQSWSFYEIDPAIIKLASDRHFFSALSLCAPGARVVRGDARLSLTQERAQSYVLIILDAYNSDQVPVHLLTREALSIYLRQLARDGVLAFHISNRHFDFAPVLAALADDANLAALERDDVALSSEDLREGKMPSSWIVMTRGGEMPSALLDDQHWHDIVRDKGLPLWTDDYTSLLRVLR